MTDVSNQPTLDDALLALDRAYNGRLEDSNLDVIYQFLYRLADVAESDGVIETDDQGHIIEGAYQNGFETIDDNCDLLVVHANALIKYVTEHRKPCWVSAQRRQPSSTAGFIVEGWARKGSVWAGMATPANVVLSGDWFVELPPFPKGLP